MRALRVVLAVVAILAVAFVGYLLYVGLIGNPRVARELIEQPDGERARKVMLLSLPGGRQLPVNYMAEGDFVYAGADGRWWKELVGDGVPVRLLIRGETFEGSARAVLDDPAYRERVFKRLRPNALEAFGTLVEIRLAESGPRPEPSEPFASQ